MEAWWEVSLLVGLVTGIRESGDCVPEGPEESMEWSEGLGDLGFSHRDQRPSAEGTGRGPSTVYRTEGHELIMWPVLHVVWSWGKQPGEKDSPLPLK